MKVLVTGCAGFIGSHLCEKLLEKGHQVIGIDCFTPYYSREFKERNLMNLRKQSNFSFIKKDIMDTNFTYITQKVNYVFHLAAQPGVRASWLDFETYVRNNIQITHKLLEGCKDYRLKFIFASSSSVYGESETYPTPETNYLKPISPYGITKMTAERLCQIYNKYYNIPIIILRYFTVYGPRQRPDMAFYKFIKSLLSDREIIVYGDGNQSRDFTYISDIVDGTLKAMYVDFPSEVINLGGENPVSINDTIKIIADILSKEPRIRYEPKQKGDVLRTSANITKARTLLNYKPKVGIKDGLKQQVEWQKDTSEKE